MDDKQRIALVETRTLGNDPAPTQLIRYQIGNHLGSATIELDDQAQIISYEEYTPYGSTAYQAVRSQTETRKRYRYTGKERDEESGLHYYGARYYAPWLAKWSSCDPAGVKGGTQAYEYAFNNPPKYRDSDGKFPVPYEMAEAWEKNGTSLIPDITGEQIAQSAGSLGEKIGGAIVDVLPSDFHHGAYAATIVKSAVDLAGGVMATIVDPGFVIRGVMRLGTGIAQGYNDYKAGEKLLGTLQIVAEATQIVGIAAGGVQMARDLHVPHTYKPMKMAPHAITKAWGERIDKLYEGLRKTLEIDEKGLSTSSAVQVAQDVAQDLSGEGVLGISAVEKLVDLKKTAGGKVAAEAARTLEGLDNLVGEVKIKLAGDVSIKIEEALSTIATLTEKLRKYDPNIPAQAARARPRSKD
jgi:RHS repeat-associated protein